jgi:hypothetical protein
VTTGVDIPVNLGGDAAAVAALHRITAALDGVGDKAAATAPKVQTLGERFAGLATMARHFNEVREFVTSFAESLINAAERVGELAGEQQRIDANTARMGLNFQQAAEQAGGFVSEMQTMQLATALANRNINVTQRELDALARVGMARAAAAGKNVEEVFDSIGDSIIEGGEELEKFGSSLHSVADESHTADERLTALVARGREVAPAMRTAADEVARFQNELRQAGRYISTGFVDEMARLQTVSSQTRGLRTDAEEARREMEALGRAGAYVLTQVGNVAGILVGAIAFSVRGIAGAFQGLGEAIRTRSLSGLRTGTAGAADDLRGIQQFIQERMRSMTAMSADAGPRTSAPATAAAAAPSDLTLTPEQTGIDPITGRRIRPPSSGGGGGGGRRETAAQRRERRQRELEQLMGRAFERSGPRAELPPLPGEQTAEQLRASGEREREGIREAREADQRKGREAYERSDAGVGAAVERERGAAREARLLDERRDQYRTFTDEMEQLAERRINVAREEAEFVSGSFQAMGRAFSDHLTAFVEGREELGTALQGMLADTLKSISEESAVKAGLNLAEGFAALATYRYDAAAQHFAASGIYASVAALAGVTAGAIAPKAANASAASASGAARSAAPMSSPSSEKAAGITVNVAFNGPQYGTGGVVQAANDLVRVINTGALQGGSQINRLAVGATGRA